MKHCIKALYKSYSRVYRECNGDSRVKHIVLWLVKIISARQRYLEKFQSRVDDLEGNRKEGKGRSGRERSVAGAWSPHDGHYAKSP